MYRVHKNIIYNSKKMETWRQCKHPSTRMRMCDAGIENRLVVAKGEGGVGGWIGSLGLADANYYI